MPRRGLTIAKTLLWCACLAPAFWIVVRGFGLSGQSLGANPVEEVLHTLGKTSLNLLIVTLSVTPLRRLSAVHWLAGLRRMLGLFCFAYSLLHLLSYVVLDQGLAWGSLFVDVTERPYSTVGMLALILMIPLTVTSTHRLQRRLGRNWLRLHRLIYPIAVLAVIHFYWQTKLDASEPIIYAFALTLLFGYLVHQWRTRRRKKSALAPRLTRAGAG